MTREEAINKWIIPAIRDTWIDKKCDEIIKALDQGPCDDCVSRQAAIDAICKECSVDDDCYKCDDLVALRALPSATPQQKTGQWNSWFTEIKGNNTFNCMECGSTFIVEQGVYNMNYCPNCGVKMIEPQESEDKE